MTTLLPMLVLVLACHTTTIHPQEASTVRVLVEGEILGGHIEVDGLHLPADTTVWVGQDLVIQARGRVLIEGRLLSFDANEVNEIVDAPTITLLSPHSIDVRGRIEGGRGRDQSGTTQRGGRGGTVTAHAPVIIIDGVVRAGDGGLGGSGARGGDGGNAFAMGLLLTREVDDESEFISGNGGSGGFPGGDGGAGGECVVSAIEPPALSPLEVQNIVVELIPEFGVALEEDPPVPPCPNGNPGAHGSDCESGNGGDGKPGADGTLANPNGKKGGDGGSSKDCTGTNGVVGLPGTDCCPNPGGAGGKGGKGGNAKSGKGGNGGRGGHGFAPNGVGGDGGKGGDSGSVKGGQAGPGGPGGKKHGAGGAPGDLATVTLGARGVGGTGGNGNPGGTDGTDGTAGSVTPGGANNPGQQGGPCPN